MLNDDGLEHKVVPSQFYETRVAGVSRKAKDCWIAWNRIKPGNDLDTHVTDVLITDDKNEWLSSNHLYRYTGGRCYSNWCVPADKREPDGFSPDQLFDPLGTFTSLLSHGFASRRVLWETLLQFATIEECGWARRMVFTLGGEWGPKDLDKLL